MSYLLQYARRPDSIAPRRGPARVDEYARLNRPGLYGDAFVRVFVEDSTATLSPRRPSSQRSCSDVVAELAPRHHTDEKGGASCRI